MFRCVEIAKNGLGNTAPNPMVGCVIVHENEIIGEGYTSPFGGNHAEVNAINSVKDKNKLPQSTLYVSLEPCSHFGKTPPCADLIIEQQFPRVYIGIGDLNPLVGGKGIDVLKNFGIDVTVGILEDECRELNKRFFTFIEKKRPYIILKWAESADGFIAPKNKNERKPVWISNKYSRQLTHKWRTEEQAILVGTNTVIDDNPTLTTRDYIGKNPIRIVLDKNGRIPSNSNVFNTDALTIVITSEDNMSRADDDDKIKFEQIKFENQQNIARQICDILYQNNINSVIIEGGKKTLQTFIDKSLWDEARVFKSESVLTEGKKSPELYGNLISTKKIETDTLQIILNNQPN